MRPRFDIVYLTLAAAISLPSVTFSQTDSVSGSSGSVSGSATISITDFPAYVSSYIGVPSSGGITAACPAGRILLGVGGSKLKFIQKITPLCGSLNKDGSVASIAALDPSAIPATAVGFSLKCGSGKSVTGIGVSYNSNTETYPYILGVEIQCRNTFAGQWSGSATYHATGGFDGWPQKSRVECSRQAQPGRSLRIRATTSVKALSLVCDEPGSLI